MLVRRALRLLRMLGDAAAPAGAAVEGIEIYLRHSQVGIQLERLLPGLRAEPFRARSPSHVVANLLLNLCWPRLCRRPIAFAKTLAASAIAPLDETRRQVIAPAIAANQFL